VVLGCPIRTPSPGLLRVQPETYLRPPPSAPHAPAPRRAVRRHSGVRRAQPGGVAGGVARVVGWWVPWRPLADTLSRLALCAGRHIVCRPCLWSVAHRPPTVYSFSVSITDLR
jgi:hypothetical protein